MLVLESQLQILSEDEEKQVMLILKSHFQALQ